MFCGFSEKTNWFRHNKESFEQLKLPDRSAIIEIGHWKDRSTVFIIEYFKPSIIYCIDTWIGS